MEAKATTPLDSPGKKENFSAPQQMMKMIKQDHPRLLISQAKLNQLKQQLSSDPLVGQWYNQLQKQGQRSLTEPPPRYTASEDKDMLATSRQTLSRVYTLALLYLLDGRSIYLERAWAELQAAANFPDWNPNNFLDTAEMTHAVAIGYDWLYQFWSPEQRALLCKAIKEKGLKPALAAYRGLATDSSYRSDHALARAISRFKCQFNWNQVLNSGIGMGALAVGSELPELAAEIVQGAVQSLPFAMALYAPDGGWGEGPMYWNYATYYNTIFLAALETALGTDFGLSQMPGFSDTGFFLLYLTGPLDLSFNFGDSITWVKPPPQLFWLAHKFNQPVFSWFRRQLPGPPEALDLVWFDSRQSDPRTRGLPRGKYFRGVEVASFRSAWGDRLATFLGFKAGNNMVTHTHLDRGSFVLDTLGQRWAMDLGADNYNLPGYWTNRWVFYRTRAEGHNTLVINPDAEADQFPDATTQIIRFQPNPPRAFAIADLTSAYKKHAHKVWRGMAFLDNPSAVLVQDEIQADKPVEVWWFMHTKAQVQLSENGRKAILTQGSAKLQMQLLSPPEAAFTVMAAQPLPTSPNPVGQARNEGIRKVAIHLQNVVDEKLVVVLAPAGADKSAPLPQLTPLMKW